MRSWMPYAWKELRENRWLGLASLGVFLGISFIPSLIESWVRPDTGWYRGNALGVFLVGGAVLALVTGVLAVGREQGAIERFWRSRPVNLNHWLLSKYVVGLAVVMLVCWTPLLIEAVGKGFAGRNGLMSESLILCSLYSFTLLLIYSISFLLGQCIRRILHAAILAVGAMAAVIVMPLTVAPLRWVSMEVVARADVGTLDAGSYAAFAATMTAISLILLGLSGAAWRRHVQIEVNQRTLGWSVVIILLALTAGAAFPMSSNLPAQQIVPLPVTQDGVIHDMATDGNDVLVLLSAGPSRGNSRLGLVRVHVGDRTSVVDEPIWFIHPGPEKKLYYSHLRLAWPAESPSLAYVVVRQTVPRDGAPSETTCALYTVAIDSGQANPVSRRVDLDDRPNEPYYGKTASLCRQRLYIYSYGYSDRGWQGRLLTFSLADPGAPSLIGSEDLAYRIGWWYWEPQQQSPVRLVPIPGLDDSTRLEITHELDPDGRWTPAGDRRILASEARSGDFIPQLALYEAGPRTDDAVPMHSIARRRFTAFAGLFGSSGGELLYADPLACRLESSGVTVYDIRDSRGIERVGHYAADGGFSTMVALPNHRVVLASKRLHVLDLSGKLSR